MNGSQFPQRIVCLTEETTEVLYLLGEDWRIVGVSGFTARPPAARLKPKVSAFTTAKFDRILELAPDLVIGFSNLQAAIARELITRGLNVLVFNQRSVDEILEMILAVARLTRAEDRGQSLVEQLRQGLRSIGESAERFPRRPRVFFEEWNEPLISGIRWVDELIEIAGASRYSPSSARATTRRIALSIRERCACAIPKLWSPRGAAARWPRRRSVAAPAGRPSGTSTR